MKDAELVAAGDAQRGIERVVADRYVVGVDSRWS